MNIVTITAAATYNCNAYGAGTYNNSNCTASDSGLANTGYDIWIPLVLGAVLFVGGVALLVRRMVRGNKLAKK
jgi:hypothetical protein